MIPARFAPILFGFLLSGMMSSIVAGISTFRSVGLIEGFGGLWAGAWLVSWAMTFPIVLVVAPVVRRIVASVTAAPKQEAPRT